MGIMNIHQFARGLWDNHEPSLSLGCKRLRPLASKHAGDTSNILDVKNYVRSNIGSNNLGPSYNINKESPSVETPSGGTRWNPTQEQIGILEMLYKGGMRTPNAQQIEEITAQLVKYGKIEGKNVFYWFQNHKARERQKQKRTNLGCNNGPRSRIAPSDSVISLDIMGKVNKEEDNPYKKKCRNWLSKCSDEESNDSCLEEEKRTLELFPLHPEGK